MGKSTDASGTTITKFHIYYAGYHMVLCHRAEKTALLRILIDDLDVYDGGGTGVLAPYHVPVYLPELFGGVESEGGIAGTFSILDGSWEQPVNDYLASVLGTPSPAYRGVVSFISRHCALQYNNPYLKDPTLKVACFHGDWHIAVREISFVETYYETISYPIAQAECTWVRWSYRECVLPYYGDPPSSWVSTAELEDPNTVIDGEFIFVPVYNETGTQSGYTIKFTPPESPVGTDWEADWRLECDYKAVEVSPGVYEVQYVCGYHCLQENTFVDLFNNFTNQEYVEITVERQRNQLAGMNPAHIIYSVLTNSFWGKGLSVDELDMDSFEAAADQLYAEGFALSMSWAKQTSIEDFLQLVIDHIGGLLVRPSTTNKYTLKLLRPGELPSFSITPEHIVRIDEYEEAGWAGTTNEYTVKYCDVLDGKTKSVTVQDLASFERQGGNIITESKEYLGLPTLELAERVAWRDLLFATVPVKKMTLVTDRSSYAVFPGDVVAVTWPPYGLDAQSFRVAEVDYGTMTSNEITLSLITDPYISELPETLKTPPIPKITPYPPINSAPLSIYEAPYWHVKTYQEATQFPNDLLDAYSFLVASGGKPQNNASGIKSLFQRGTNPEEAGSAVAFCGALKLRYSVSPTDTVFFLDPGYYKDLNRFTVGGLAYVGGVELVEVAVLDLSLFRLTVHRGILDTVPVAHAAGAFITSFNSLELARSYITWLNGDAAKAWILTQCSTGTLAQEDATELSLSVTGRQGRPLPPGNLRVSSIYLNPLFIGEIFISWSHRNRLTQTTPTFIHQEDLDVVPEAGTEYLIKLYDENGLKFLETTTNEESGGGLPSPGTWTEYEHDVAASAAVAETIVLATTAGNAHTGAGVVSDTTFSSTSTTTLTFKWKYTGTRYAVYPSFIGLCAPGFTRESYYGAPNTGIGIFIGGNSVSGFTMYGYAAPMGTYTPSYALSFVADTEYSFEITFNWAAGTMSLTFEGELKGSVAIPVGYTALNASYKVVAHFPNYENVASVTISELAMASDGIPAFSFIDSVGGGTAVGWNYLSYSLPDELMATGKLNRKVGIELTAKRDGFDSWTTLTHTAYRGGVTTDLGIVNPNFSTDLTGWNIVTGTPIARAVSELGFSSCGTSTRALGNSVAGLANQWTVSQVIDLTAIADPDNLADGCAVIELGIRHRATAVGSFGLAYFEFFDDSMNSLGVEASGPFAISNTALGTKTLKVPVKAGSTQVGLVLSCSSSSGDVTGYFGCLTGYLHEAASSVLGDPHFSSVELLLHCEGEDGATTWIDSSPSPKTVSYTGTGIAISTDRSAAGLSSTEETGNDSDINVPAGILTGTDQFTIEGWFWFEADQSSHAYGVNLISQGGTSGSTEQLFGINQITKALQFVRQSGLSYPITLVSTATVPDSDQVHLALTWDGATIRGFIGGTLVFSGACAAGWLNTGQPFRLGRNYNPSYSEYRSGFSGFFDEIRVTKYCRYTEDFIPATPPYPDSSASLLDYAFESTQSNSTGSYVASFTDNTVLLSASAGNAGNFGANLEARFVLPEASYELRVPFNRLQTGPWFDDDFTDASLIIYVVPGADHGEVAYDASAWGYRRVAANAAAFAIKKATGTYLTHYSWFGGAAAQHLLPTTGPWDGASTTLELRIRREVGTSYMILEMWEGTSLLSILPTDVAFPTDGMVVFHWHAYTSIASEELSNIAATVFVY